MYSRCFRRPAIASSHPDGRRPLAARATARRGGTLPLPSRPTRQRAARARTIPCNAPGVLSCWSTRANNKARGATGGVTRSRRGVCSSVTRRRTTVSGFDDCDLLLSPSKTTFPRTPRSPAGLLRVLVVRAARALPRDAAAAGAQLRGRERRDRRGRLGLPPARGARGLAAPLLLLLLLAAAVWPSSSSSSSSFLPPLTNECIVVACVEPNTFAVSGWSGVVATTLRDPPRALVVSQSPALTQPCSLRLDPEKLGVSTALRDPSTRSQ